MANQHPASSDPNRPIAKSECLLNPLKKIKNQKSKIKNQKSAKELRLRLLVTGKILTVFFTVSFIFIYKKKTTGADSTIGCDLGGFSTVFNYIKSFPASH